MILDFGSINHSYQWLYHTTLLSTVLSYCLVGDILLDTVGGTFRAGDSVRLKMQEAMMDSEFLLSDLNHFSVGYIHTVDDDGDVS